MNDIDTFSMQQLKQKTAPPTRFRMTTTVEMIGPEKAEEYTRKAHPNQRKLRNNAVEQYAAAMKAGQWVLTPDGIAFDCEGNLIQGNHRLHAILRSGMTLPFNVTRNASEKSFAVLDQGLRRSYADAIGAPRKDIELATVMVRVISNNNAQGRSVHDAANIYYCLRPYIDSMNAAWSRTSRAGITAAVRSGVLFRHVMGENAAYLGKMYSAMVTNDYESFSPVCAALYRRLTDNNLSATGWSSKELLNFALAFKYFDSAREQQRRVSITQDEITQIRNKVRFELGLCLDNDNASA